MGKGTGSEADGVSVLFEWDFGASGEFFGAARALLRGGDKRKLIMFDGPQKGVMISHRNVIANTLQLATFEKPNRDRLSSEAGKDYLDIGLGLLPMSHIYSLIVVCHASTYRGDQVIVLPKFELRAYCEAIQRFTINTLYLVCAFFWSQVTRTLDRITSIKFL